MKCSECLWVFSQRLSLIPLSYIPIHHNRPPYLQASASGDVPVGSFKLDNRDQRIRIFSTLVDSVCDEITKIRAAPNHSISMIVDLVDARIVAIVDYLLVRARGTETWAQVTLHDRVSIALVWISLDLKDDMRHCLWNDLNYFISKHILIYSKDNISTHESPWLGIGHVDLQYHRRLARYQPHRGCQQLEPGRRQMGCRLQHRSINVISKKCEESVADGSQNDRKGWLTVSRFLAAVVTGAGL